jgi:hypothetical protein
MRQPPGLWPDRAYFRELLRPWKLGTLALGMAWLIHGAVSHGICDWDVGVSLVMGGLTYLLAPWSVTTISASCRFRPPGWPVRIAAAFVPSMLAVDWSYWLYHSAMGNRMLRWENFKVSMALYFLCGILWCYRGSARELVEEVRRGRVGLGR